MLETTSRRRIHLLEVMKLLKILISPSWTRIPNQSFPSLINKQGQCKVYPLLYKLPVYPHFVVGNHPESNYPFESTYMRVAVTARNIICIAHESKSDTYYGLTYDVSETLVARMVVLIEW